MEALKGSQDAGRLPFSAWWPFLAGAIAGIALRLLFSAGPGEALSAMSSAFVFPVPFAVGAVAIYAAERKARRSWKYHFGAGAVANLAFIAGTMLALIEGLLCAVIIAPLFALMGGIGGLCMGFVCRRTNWPKQTVSGFVFLPLLLAPLEGMLELPTSHDTVTRSVLIAAPAQHVWSQLLDAPRILEDDVPPSWLYRIGMPKPTAGLTRRTPEGGLVREVTMGKGIRFEEVITHADAPRFIRWTYRFDKDSFPPHALDEHVVIGGHYFDVRDTSYELSDEGNNTRMTVRMTYRVSTHFNWYARPVAEFLLSDLVASNLRYYKDRSERVRASHG